MRSKKTISMQDWSTSTGSYYQSASRVQEPFNDMAEEKMGGNKLSRNASHRKILISNRYRVEKKLGEGAFGVLYQGVDVRSNQLVAIKLESTNYEDAYLQYEANIYAKLQDLPGIARLHWHGVQDDYNVMILDMLGPNLKELFQFCNYQFTDQTLSWIAYQMISRVEVLHKKNYVHRDIKPQNFLMGTGKTANDLFMIDFGLAKRFICPKSGKHIEQKQKRYPTGTMKYNSAKAHQAFEQSRKDDLISIGHVLLYFANNGQLPWSECECKKTIIKMKQDIDLDHLLDDDGASIKKYIQVVNQLSFEEKPNYQMLKSIFLEQLQQYSQEKPLDICLDWLTQKKKLIFDKMSKEKKQNQMITKKIDSYDEEDEKNINQLHSEIEKQEKEMTKQERQVKRRQQMREEMAIKKSKDYQIQVQKQRAQIIQQDLEFRIKNMEINAQSKQKVKKLEGMKRYEEIFQEKAKTHRSSKLDEQQIVLKEQIGADKQLQSVKMNLFKRLKNASSSDTTASQNSRQDE